MKKIYAGLLVTLITFHFSCKKSGDLSSTSQKRDARYSSKSENKSDLYYWSGGKKITLTIDSTVAIFLATDTTSALSTLKNTYKNATFAKLSSGYFLIKGPEKLALKSLVQKSINAQYSFNISSEQLIPTGEIVLELDAGQDIRDILDKTQAKLTVLAISKYNTYLVRVEDNSSVLDVANFIHETGLVKYCLPNFIMKFSKTSTDPMYSNEYYL